MVKGVARLVALAIQWAYRKNYVLHVAIVQYKQINLVFHLAIMSKRILPSCYNGGLTHENEVKIFCNLVVKDFRVFFLTKYVSFMCH